jgi:hypothetical protein
MKSGLALTIGLLLAFSACERQTYRTRAAPEPGEKTWQQEQRDEYVSTVRARLNEFDGNIRALELSAATMPAAARTSYEQSLQQLRNQQKTVQEKLERLEAMAPESWMSMRTEVDLALNELENSYQRFSRGER